MNFCKDCKHFRELDRLCLSKEAFKSADVVTGCLIYRSARSMRMGSAFAPLVEPLCGIEGKLFEPK